MNAPRRVVVTGLGTISPLGQDVPTTWAGIVAGRSGVASITKFDTTGYKTTIAAEVKGFDAKQHFAPKDVRRMDPFSQYALVAAREALRDAAFTFDNGRAERTAVVVGSGIGGITTTSEGVLLLKVVARGVTELHWLADVACLAVRSDPTGKP